MTATIWLCLMGLVVFGGDPDVAGDPPARGRQRAQVSRFGGRRGLRCMPRPPPPARTHPAAPADRRPPQYPPSRRRAGTAASARGRSVFQPGRVEGGNEEARLDQGRFHHHPLWHSVGQSGRGSGTNLPRQLSPLRVAAAGGRERRLLRRRAIDAAGVRRARPVGSACSAAHKVGGKVEIDFQRQIDVENKASLLLRHAYVEVKDDEFRLLAGQTWDVISPLCPGVLFYSVGWDGGNIGYRRPQFRGGTLPGLLRQLRVDRARLAQHRRRHPTRRGTADDVRRAYSSAWPILEGRVGHATGAARAGMPSLGVRRVQPRGRIDLRLPSGQQLPTSPPRSACPVAPGRSTPTCTCRSPTPSACRGNCSWARPWAHSSAASARAWTWSRTPIRKHGDSLRLGRRHPLARRLGRPLVRLDAAAAQPHRLLDRRSLRRRT